MLLALLAWNCQKEEASIPEEDVTGAASRSAIQRWITGSSPSISGTKCPILRVPLGERDVRARAGSPSAMYGRTEWT